MFDKSESCVTIITIKMQNGSPRFPCTPPRCQPSPHPGPRHVAFLDYHTKGNTGVAFRVWLLAPEWCSRGSPGLLRGPAVHRCHCRALFPHREGPCSLLSHPPVEGRVDCSRFLEIAKKTPINIRTGFRVNIRFEALG